MRRDYGLLFFLALIVGVGLMLVIKEPGYTDAYYYYNAGHRLANGDGLTDPYLWIYLNIPDKLPTPSHTYWMPFSSLVIAASMTLFGESFAAAQLPSLLALAGLISLTGWLGGHLGGSRRYVWLSGLIVLFGGFFFPFWLTTDTFAIYGLIGAGALITTGLGHKHEDWRWFIAVGLLGGFAHLTRADGILLIVVALLVVWWPRSRSIKRLYASLALILSYFLVMLPWFLRNFEVIDAPLPSGGVNTAFLRGYNEIFAYPIDWSADNFFEWGLGNILQSRWETLVSNLGTWVAVETLVLLGPFALWTFWKHRQNPFLTGFWLYALGLHLAMTIVFAYPGYRGGLFHSSAALMPFWATLGVIGLDAGIEYMANWRNWKPQQARWVFGGAVIVLAVFLSLSTLGGRLNNLDAAPDYETLAIYLPDDAVLMVNDPAAWYYHTGLTGFTLPDAPLERLPEMAQRFCLTHLILDRNVTRSFNDLIDGKADPPAFLEEIQFLDQGTKTTKDDVRIYRFTLEPDSQACAAYRP